MAAQLDWGSEATFHKLVLASYLHDITLENQELAAVRTLSELEDKKKLFTATEKKAFKDHPNEAAKLVTSMSEAPPDVDTIIRQHHELPNGSGFPSGIGHKHIAPLASVFIVAHDLTRYTLESKSDFNIEVFLQGVREKYQSTHFKKLLAALEVLRRF